MSLILCMCYLRSVYFYRSSVEKCGKLSKRGAFAMGSILALGQFVAWYISGASFNPARSFGPAAISNYWLYHWIYWAGPFIGAIGAVLLNILLFELPGLKVTLIYRMFVLVGSPNNSKETAYERVCTNCHNCVTGQCTNCTPTRKSTPISIGFLKQN